MLAWTKRMFQLHYKHQYTVLKESNYRDCRILSLGRKATAAFLFWTLLKKPKNPTQPPFPLLSLACNLELIKYKISYIPTAYHLHTSAYSTHKSLLSAIHMGKKSQAKLYNKINKCILASSFPQLPISWTKEEVNKFRQVFGQKYMLKLAQRTKLLRTVCRSLIFKLHK